jgi:hypothetical protein
MKHAAVSALIGASIIVAGVVAGLPLSARAQTSQRLLVDRTPLPELTPEQMAGCIRPLIRECDNRGCYDRPPIPEAQHVLQCRAEEALKKLNAQRNRQ